jgi:glycosyltransferase involved in cell wall biosynthesis
MCLAPADASRILTPYQEIRLPSVERDAERVSPGSRRLTADRLRVTLETEAEVTLLINGKRIVVVLPAYNAAKTLETTVRELPEIVDESILVDDHSNDDTAEVARRLGLTVEVHPRNRGYGGNQKTCYAKALARGADVVVMLHPDYQYNPLLVTPIATMIAYGVYDLALGSRILGGGALRGGMPVYKYISNRFLTLVQNLLMGAKLSEYHTGFRAYSRELLEAMPLERNSDDFVFDNQVIAQAVLMGARIGEISCPTRYFPEASSINFRRSAIYGLGVLRSSLQFRLAKWGLGRAAIFKFPEKAGRIGKPDVLPFEIER